MATLAVSVLVVAGCGAGTSAPVGASASPSTGSATVQSSAVVSTADSATTSTSSTASTDPTTTTSSTATAPPPLDVGSTGVRGRVVAGPTCPVERPDQPCPPQPVQGMVTATDSREATAGSTATDADGRYALAQPPGDYVLRVTTANGPFPRCPDSPVSVTDGPPATVDIDCDTGIR